MKHMPIVAEAFDIGVMGDSSGRQCLRQNDSGEVKEDRTYSKKRRINKAALIKKVYEVDPLRCPDCGGEMNVISFIDKCQADVVEKIFRMCGLWKEAVSRPPSVVIRVAEGEPDYDYGNFERVSI